MVLSEIVTIEQITLSRLCIPLAKPYKLALGNVTHFDTLLVELVADGRPGFGEATILSGYTDETVEGSWALAQVLTRKLNGLPVEAARRMLQASVQEAPFTITAFATALEMARGHALLNIERATSFRCSTASMLPTPPVSSESWRMRSRPAIAR
jgi:L-alanine-DL-glutamate epimerase-like enolase superfamily enzyme